MNATQKINHPLFVQIILPLFLTFQWEQVTNMRLPYPTFIDGVGGWVTYAIIYREQSEPKMRTGVWQQ